MAVFVALVGIVFLHVGRQSITGTAAGTAGNGSGSIVFGVLGGLAAISYFRVGVPLLGIVQSLSALGLLTAGIMALMAGSEYANWRKAQSREREHDRDRSRNHARNRNRDDGDD